MTAFDPSNALHVAAWDRLQTGEALLVQARINAELAKAAKREGRDPEAVRDAVRVILDLARLELDRSLACVEETEA